jgi:hypothetical protein
MQCPWHTCPSFHRHRNKLILPSLRLSLSSKPQHRTHINSYSSKYLTWINDSYKEVPVHAKRVYGGSEIHSFLTSALDGREGSTSSSDLFITGAIAPLPSEQEDRWHRRRSGRFGEKKVLPGSEPKSSAVQSVAQSLYRLHHSASNNSSFAVTR